MYARSSAGGKWHVGSGYFLGGSIFLTSRHIVQDTSGAIRDTVQIHLRDAAQLVDCQLLWHGDGDVDAALVRIVTDGAKLPVRRYPPRWGRFATSTPRQPCHAVGYPAFEGQSPDHDRVASQVTGTINPLTGLGHARLSIDVDNAPAELSGHQSLWAGMSGSAVLCDDTLVAIVRQDAAHFDSRRLSAVPVELCAADPAFRELVAAAAGQEPVLEPVDLATLFAEQERPRSPAALLAAPSHTVEFRGRDAELTRLREWCARDEGFSAHIVAGPGGQGKTRLAAQFVGELAADGWVAGFVRDADPEEFAVLGALRGPALLVVDYAETRPATIAALTAATRRAESGVRLLLLARSAGEWREDAAIDHSLDYLVDTSVLPLAALERTPHGRLTAWREAVSSLGNALSHLDGYEHAGAHTDEVITTPPTWLATDLHDDVPVLGIHMDALAALLTAAEPGTTGESSMDTLLLHEEKYWKRMATARGFVADKHTLADAVAVSTLFAVTTQPEALALVAAMPGLRDLPEDRRTAAVHWLAGTLPSSEGFWGTLQPDRLGEHHVARVLNGRAELITPLVDVASTVHMEHAFTVLCRAAVDAGHLNAVIEAVIDESPRTTGPAALSVAVQSENPAPLLAGIRRVVERADTDLLSTLSDVTPVHTQILADIGIDISQRLVAAQRTAPEQDGLSLARRLATLAVRLRNRGRFEDAVRVNQEAIELFDRFADLSDNAQLLDLGSALGSLADQLSRLDRIPESLDVSKRSVAIARRVATAGPGTPAHLAGALNGFASRLGIAGEHHSASVIAAEAVEINRDLTGGVGGEAYRPGLATSLNILGVQQSMDHGPKQGLSAIQEALEIRRELAKAQPDAYLAQLAASLNNFSNWQWSVGGPRDGLEASEEAVAILRRLGEANPEAHHQDLVRALSNLVRRLDKLQLAEAAAEAGRELVRISRSLAEARPEQHQSEFAAALVLTASCLAACGEMAEAVDLATEAIALYRSLPTTPLRPLARALQARAEWLLPLRRGADATASMAECVAIHRLLAAEDGGEKLAGALLHFADFLMQVRQDEQARSAVEEAVELRRALATASRPGQWSEVAATLTQLATVLEAQGLGKEALTAMSEAVGIRRRLTVSPRLAGTLGVYADLLTRAGRYWDAKNALEEAIRIQRQLKAPRQRRRLGQLFMSLARMQVQLNMSRDAARSAADAVATWRPLANANDKDSQKKLVSALQELAQILTTLGRTADAARATAEADRVRKLLTVTERGPSRHRDHGSHSSRRLPSGRTVFVPETTSMQVKPHFDIRG
ncbi:hypothetical protein GCM10027184_17620 [Saccharothrix stipae]